MDTLTWWWSENTKFNKLTSKIIRIQHIKNPLFKFSEKKIVCSLFRNSTKNSNTQPYFTNQKKILKFDYPSA